MYAWRLVILQYHSLFRDLSLAGEDALLVDWELYLVSFLLTSKCTLSLTARLSFTSQSTDENELDSLKPTRSWIKKAYYN